MAARPDLPRLQGARPSFFNSTASTFGVIGGGLAYAATSLIPSLGTAITGWLGGAASTTAAAAGAGAAATTAAAVATIAAPVAAAIGVGLMATAVGAVVGKTRMQNELISGRVVREPSFLNKGLMNGLFLGGAVALGIMAAPALLPAAAAAAIPTALTGTGALAAIAAIPAVIGSFMTRGTQTRETVTVMQQASVVARQAQAERARSAGIQPSRSSSVTAEEAALLESRLKNGPAQGKSFADQVLASRAAAQGELART